MPLRKSILIMTNTGTEWTVIGEPVRSDSYYGYTDGVVTVQVIYQNLVGRFGIQGTLSLDPQPEDWFWIEILPRTSDYYVTFPVDSLHPTGQNGGDTGSTAFTFIGNFTFLRAVLFRDYLQEPSSPGWDTWTYGQIDKVLLSL